MYEHASSNMTLEEKCALLTGAKAFESRPLPHRGVPSLRFSDGPHGLRVQAEGANHLGIGGSKPATCFPTAVTIANSWNPKLAHKVAAALGSEAREQDVDVLLGPGLNIKRHPCCGRNFEYFSEDPFLSGHMASEFIQGVQSQGVAACPKHFAVNSQETRRLASDSVLDERTLREIYLRAFEICVKDADPASIMTSYNLMNGTYANENEHLLQDILHHDWGFKGAVVTDWGGSNDHVAGVRAGSTIQMPGPAPASVRELIEAVRNGSLPEAVVDARVQELLGLAARTHGIVNAAEPEPGVTHHQLALQAAQEGIVLLRNTPCGVGEHALPLKPGARVALIGDFAKRPRYQGAGSSLVCPTQLDTLLGLAGKQPIELVGYAPGFRRDGSPDVGLTAEAAALACTADVAILCLGLTESDETEGADRTHLELATNQRELLRAVSKVANRTIVALFSGSPVAIDWEDEADGIVYAALGGQAGAGALWDVLTGAICPSGKLAETWPLHLKDVPCGACYPEQGPHAVYREGLYVGYRYYATAREPVLYPFGYGLSYTTFDYRDLAVSDDRCSAEVTVRNTGDCAGAEIVQLYVGKQDARIFRAARELKGFAKVWLRPGAETRVHIDLDDRAFEYFNTQTNGWEVEGGTYEVMVGASCEDIRLSTAIEVEGTDAPDPYRDLDLAAYRTGQVQGVSDAEVSDLLGHDLPSSKVTVGPNMCFRDLNHGRSPVFWLVWAVMHALVRAGERRNKPNLNVLYIYNMPLRALATNAGSVFSPGMVDALVMEIRGFWFIGFARLLFEWLRAVWENGALERELAYAEEQFDE